MVQAAAACNFEPSNFAHRYLLAEQPGNAIRMAQRTAALIPEGNGHSKDVDARIESLDPQVAQ